MIEKGKGGVRDGLRLFVGFGYAKAERPNDLLPGCCTGGQRLPIIDGKPVVPGYDD